MGLKSDKWIVAQAAQGMITPFAANQHREGVISYGVSSYGYDLRVADEFKIFNGYDPRIWLDPKNFDHALTNDYTGSVCVVPEHGFVLARSVEYLKIPRNVMTICLGKSTYQIVAD